MKEVNQSSNFGNLSYSSLKKNIDERKREEKLMCQEFYPMTSTVEMLSKYQRMHIA